MKIISIVGVRPQFIKRALMFREVYKVNDFMPMHMDNLMAEAFLSAGKKTSGSRFALLGWALISNSVDARNSLSDPYRNLLVDAGCRLDMHDPHVLEYPNVDISHELSDALKGADVMEILTGHDEYFGIDSGVFMEEEHAVIVNKTL